MSTVAGEHGAATRPNLPVSLKGGRCGGSRGRSLRYGVGPGRAVKRAVGCHRRDGVIGRDLRLGFRGRLDNSLLMKLIK
jgi:hypothetical protein